MNVLVIDIGGTQVKMLVTEAKKPRRFDSGRTLSPTAMMERVREMTEDWTYDAVSLGYPGHVGPNGPEQEPGKLGVAWVGFDFEEAFGRPVRIVNDAVMQALGAYDGGRMLFLGLGTGVGSALVSEHVVVPLELGNLEYRPGEPLGVRLGSDGRERYGHDRWLHVLREVTGPLRAAFAADYLVLGGGNAEYADPLPAGCRRGGNEDAFTGGFRLWEEMVEPHDRKASPAWRLVS